MSEGCGTTFAHRTATEIALREVRTERYRQEQLKAEGRFARTPADNMSHTERLAVLGEEFGEVCRAILELQRLANDSHNKDLRKGVNPGRSGCGRLG